MARPFAYMFHPHTLGHPCRRWQRDGEPKGPRGRAALEGKGPQRRPQRRLDRRLEVAKAVGGGYCRLQMPLKVAFGVRGQVAGHMLGALEGGGGYSPPSNASLPRGWGGVP